MRRLVTKLGTRTMPTLKLTEKTLDRPWLPEGKAQLLIFDQELSGFLIVIGRRQRTFAVRYRIDGVRRQYTIGHHGALMPGSRDPWNVQRARARAREILGQVAAGADPAEPERARRDGPTLRDGLALHLENMVKDRCSEKGKKTLEAEVKKHLADWLDRPILELTAPDLHRLHAEIQRKTERRAGGNPDNLPGAALANRVIRHVRAIWNSLDGQHEFDARNPAAKVEHYQVDARQSRINDDEFAPWYAKVVALKNGVRRDLNLFALLTGARDGSVRHVRWEDVDWENPSIKFVVAKGDKPYRVPLGKRAIEILRRREKENAVEFEEWGGDHGWVFPALTRAKPFEVRPVAESKETRYSDAAEAKSGKVRVLRPIHDLRRTYNSVAKEKQVPLEVRNTLMNHENAGVNEEHYVNLQDWSLYAATQQQIEDVLWAKLTEQKRPSTPSSTPAPQRGDTGRERVARAARKAAPRLSPSSARG